MYNAAAGSSRHFFDESADLQGSLQALVQVELSIVRSIEKLRNEFDRCIAVLDTLVSGGDFYPRDDLRACRQLFTRLTHSLGAFGDHIEPIHRCAESAEGPGDALRLWLTAMFSALHQHSQKGVIIGNFGEMIARRVTPKPSRWKSRGPRSYPYTRPIILLREADRLLTRVSSSSSSTRSRSRFIFPGGGRRHFVAPAPERESVGIFGRRIRKDKSRAAPAKGEASCSPYTLSAPSRKPDIAIFNPEEPPPIRGELEGSPTGRSSRSRSKGKARAYPIGGSPYPARVAFASIADPVVSETASQVDAPDEPSALPPQPGSELSLANQPSGSGLRMQFVPALVKNVLSKRRKPKDSSSSSKNDDPSSSSLCDPQSPSPSTSSPQREDNAVAPAVVVEDASIHSSSSTAPDSATSAPRSAHGCEPNTISSSTLVTQSTTFTNTSGSTDSPVSQTTSLSSHPPSYSPSSSIRTKPEPTTPIDHPGYVLPSISPLSEFEVLWSDGNLSPNPAERAGTLSPIDVLSPAVTILHLEMY
ncbi:hypothetical protein JAAARDRAFT_60848 [Jaapia argillacea MUCL 33604]|uniref:Uncharacterized protein n=1 Tax=Jaapia argillacea MUCL 33604 TaxID=933084 RepID=A0A067PRY3_9AGAM|nr:hypothetical protein JAAARDRAFT_60848 [Jaapia argillacea MUCL 33604]